MRTTKLTSVLVESSDNVFMPVQLTAQSPATPSPATLHTISELSWLAGDWQTAPGGRSQTEEHWTQPAGASMLGMSRTVIGGTNS